MPTIIEAGQTPAVEPVKPQVQPAISEQAQEAPVKPTEDPVSPKFAALARQERAIRAEKMRIKAERESIAAEKLQMEALKGEYQSKYIPKDRLTQDTLGVLSELGITGDQLTTAMLNAPNPELRKLQQRLDQIEAQEKSIKDSIDKQNKDSYSQAINAIKNETKVLIDGDERFESVKEFKLIDDVVKKIENKWKSDQVLLTVEEAALEVEKEFEEVIKKAMGLKKMKSLTQPAEPEAKPDTKQQVTQQPQTTMKTLTNAVVQASTTKPLNEKDRVKRAIAAFKGELK